MIDPQLHLTTDNPVRQEAARVALSYGNRFEDSPAGEGLRVRKIEYELVGGDKISAGNVADNGNTITVHHPNPTISDKIMHDVANRLFMLEPGQPREERARILLAAYTGFIGANRCCRGTAAIANVLWPTLTHVALGTKKALPDGMDLFALVMDRGDFIERYLKAKIGTEVNQRNYSR